ncbi:LETM1-related biofilm-associated protein [Aurantibacter sp.]|uniref:LETM1-related biofilm-associated protein n=1 Tax=Aurantibacter sp. TaxID=2807103 RepID=UPI0035C811F7
MNPSSSGWIKKYETLSPTIHFKTNTFKDLYSLLNNCGFIYGFSTNLIFNFKNEQDLTQEEIEKLNVLTAFFCVYKLKNRQPNFANFIESLLIYFEKIDVFDLSLWDKFIAGKDKYQQLERIINEHVQIDTNLLTKHFNKKTTNSLLFIDVIAYYNLLNSKVDIKTYYKDLEYIVANITSDVISFKKEYQKEQKTTLKSISNSFLYQNESTNKIDLNYNQIIESEYGVIENTYFLDVAALTIWETDFENDSSYNFLKKLGTDMCLSEKNINISINNMAVFFNKAKDSKLFRKTNALNNFYDNASELVIRLIKRNSKRIIKELSQSKELMLLLSQSTFRELTKEEQEKVQLQLLDILKTIPSLAIFLLPGGAILLPIFAKLIPNLLPSAFNDNKIEE